MSTNSGIGNILTINSGSSSLKFALFRGAGERLIRSGRLEGTGSRSSGFHLEGPDGNVLLRESPALPDHAAALKILLDRFKEIDPDARIHAVGHRIVHGGDRYREPHLINAGLVSALRRMVPLAPDHLPHEIAAIEAIARLARSIPQAACFDTAFHCSMPQVASVYALPRNIRKAGVKKYGFHGLSYEYITEEFRREAASNIIIAHLGNGASMAAVKKGKSIDTTMGFTPAGGLVMSTRSGDMDPGVFPYILAKKHLSPQSLDELINGQSGLLGISGMSGDMKDLLGRGEDNAGAALAVSVFCYQAGKFLGALAAALGGIDTVIFTGGIGENSPEVRSRICAGLNFMGIRLNRRANNRSAPVISAKGSPVRVRVMKTNEELMIVRHTCKLLQGLRGARSAGG